MPFLPSNQHRQSIEGSIEKYAIKQENNFNVYGAFGGNFLNVKIVVKSGKWGGVNLKTFKNVIKSDQAYQLLQYGNLLHTVSFVFACYIIFLPR